jgi:site-specific recombinase XerD
MEQTTQQANILAIPDQCWGTLPAIIENAGGNAPRRFVEFFTANIRNLNTRQAYARAVRDFFNWCDLHRLSLQQLQPILVAAYIEELQKKQSAPTVKQHLAAIRMLFDYLVIGQVIPMNPAASVRGPKYVTKCGKTPVLSAIDARTLLNSIDTSTVVGLRDRAMIATMVYTFARVSAVTGMKVEDYYQNGKRWWVRLHEKGGKFHEVPTHHLAEEYIDAYIEVAGIANEKKRPLFRTTEGRTRILNDSAMTRSDVLRMIKRRVAKAGLPVNTCCHTFRATGITTYLENGGTIEKAQMIAAHESPRTTKLYDRTGNQLSLDEIERIVI